VTRWQTTSSKVVYENPWIKVHEDTTITPDGKDGLYGWIESKSQSVFVVPIDDDGFTYIINQERYTRKKFSWEGIAGRTDGEPYDVAAKRELLEETGVRANKITVLTEIEIANGVTSFSGAICLARDLQETNEKIDAAEGISEVKKLPLTEVVNMIMRGEIVDSQTIAATFMAMEYLRGES
jgi:8-oxo-dGTP pyrophosphatase MutT (NUDIX family)